MELRGFRQPLFYRGGRKILYRYLYIEIAKKNTVHSESRLISGSKLSTKSLYYSNKTHITILLATCHVMYWSWVNPGQKMGKVCRTWLAAYIPITSCCLKVSFSLWVFIRVTHMSSTNKHKWSNLTHTYNAFNEGKRMCVNYMPYSITDWLDNMISANLSNTCLIFI